MNHCLIISVAFFVLNYYSRLHHPTYVSSEGIIYCGREQVTCLKSEALNLTSSTPSSCGLGKEFQRNMKRSGKWDGGGGGHEIELLTGDGCLCW